MKNENGKMRIPCKMLYTILISLFFLAGCAVAKIPYYASPEKEQAAKNMKPIEGKALLYVIMTGYQSERVVVYDDDNKDFTMLVQKAYHMAQIEPGKRTITAVMKTSLHAGFESEQTALATTFSLDAEPGQTYYLVTKAGTANIGRTVLSGGSYAEKQIDLFPIEPKQGREYVNQYRLSNTTATTEYMASIIELLQKRRYE